MKLLVEFVTGQRERLIISFDLLFSRLNVAVAARTILTENHRPVGKIDHQQVCRSGTALIPLFRGPQMSENKLVPRGLRCRCR